MIPYDIVLGFLGVVMAAYALGFQLGVRSAKRELRARGAVFIDPRQIVRADHCRHDEHFDDCPDCRH